MESEQLYDVVVYEISTGVIYSFVGDALLLGLAIQRRDSILDRLNDRYTAAIVHAGKYGYYDTLAKGDR